MRKDASARTRDKEGIVFVRTGREAGVLIIAELFSEVVTVSQPVPGEQETDITDGIRLSDWYYKYKKSSESNGKRKLTAVCSHQTRIGNLDAHLI
ncbi:hypothetical protein [Escherichia coli]|uniref:hypothetical protein n=4 Tax=Escherichia coli TaxID=562 RepID=UPI0029170591|nr:hypothetical protein [Escherichia coli]